MNFPIAWNLKFLKKVKNFPLNLSKGALLTNTKRFTNQITCFFEELMLVGSSNKLSNLKMSSENVCMFEVLSEVKNKFD
jgi:hypothetical protein